MMLAPFAHYYVERVTTSERNAELVWHGPRRFASVAEAAAHAVERLAEVHAMGQPWNTRALRAVLWLVPADGEPVRAGVATRHGFQAD